MISPNVLILLLCAPITSQTPQLLSATLGSSVLIPCSLPVPLLRLRWFYWQEDQSSNILFHWDPKSQTLPVADKYMNRCQAFISEYSSGNISIRLDNVSVEDDLKTFWTYVSVYDEKRKLIKPSEQRCKSTLQVSSPYKDQLLTINKNNNSATCTAHGGYPEPKVSWTGLNKSNAAQLDLQDAETSLQRDPTEKTFSVTSCVSVKELQSVTCIVTNPHSHKIIKRTAKIDDPGEDQQRHHWIPIFTPPVIIIVIILLIMYFYRTGKQLPPASSAEGEHSAEENASNALHMPSRSGSDSNDSVNEGMVRRSPARRDGAAAAAGAGAEEETLFNSNAGEESGSENGKDK